MQYNEQPLTLQDIREASTNYLKACLQEDLDVYVRNMMQTELDRRHTRRRIN